MNFVWNKDYDIAMFGEALTYKNRTVLKWEVPKEARLGNQ